MCHENMCFFLFFWKVKIRIFYETLLRTFFCRLLMKSCPRCTLFIIRWIHLIFTAKSIGPRGCVMWNIFMKKSNLDLLQNFTWITLWMQWNFYRGGILRTLGVLVFTCLVLYKCIYCSLQTGEVWGFWWYHGMYSSQVSE